mgnify:CR=1 FL=1
MFASSALIRARAALRVCCFFYVWRSSFAVLRCVSRIFFVYPVVWCCWQLLLGRLVSLFLYGLFILRVLELCLRSCKFLFCLGFTVYRTVNLRGGDSLVALGVD